MLEIFKGTAAKNYENTFFREFSDNLAKMFDKYTLDGLLIANSECKDDERLQIDILLVTNKTVCIIELKNYGGTITLPEKNQNDYQNKVWKNDKGTIVRGGNSANPFVQLKKQKERFIRVVNNYVINKLPKTDKFNPFHTIKAVCFQKSVNLFGEIPGKDELTFFVLDRNNYLEKIKDMIDINQSETFLSKDAFDVFKKVFRAELYDLNESYNQADDFYDHETDLDYEALYPDQKTALKKITNFIKSENDKIFILDGTSLSGKSHLIPYIQEMAFKNNVPEVKLFALSNRVANNLLENNYLEFSSIYSYIYGGKRKPAVIEDTEITKTYDDENTCLEIVPLKYSDDIDNAIYIVDESQLITATKFKKQINFLEFGTGCVLKDFIEFANIKNTRRKIIFIGDSYQITMGKYNSLNVDYFSNEYNLQPKYFQLEDKENKSMIVTEAFKLINGIRTNKFNNLDLTFSDALENYSKENFKLKLKLSILSNENSRVLYKNKIDCHEMNLWIKNNILHNGKDIAAGDLIIFNNTIQVSDNNSSDADIKKIFNGQFAKVLNVSEPETIADNLPAPLTFREIFIQLNGSNSIYSITSFENFRLSENGDFSKNEKIAYYTLLNKLAEQELDNFINGNYYTDKELLVLLSVYDKSTRKGITKILNSIKKQLSLMPETRYYKIFNAAQLRFGWAITVNKAMSYKWDEIFLVIKNNEKNFRKSYFKWIYTGLIRATDKVNLLGYKPITPFSKIEIVNSSNTNGDEPIFIASANIDVTKQDKIIMNKYNFSNSVHCLFILQLYSFIFKTISKKKWIIASIEHHQYKEIYEIINNKNDAAIISIYYNKEGVFKNHSVQKCSNIEFANELLDLLNSGNIFKDFSFIQDDWRMAAYVGFNDKLNLIGFSFSFLTQKEYHDVIYINTTGKKIIMIMYYNKEGFFTKVSINSCGDALVCEKVQNLLQELKGV